ncbi:MAG TPA: hypothetical protein VFP22_02880 [Candidatus Limnocylindrales bacterium]|nr:hypothetical protein [Candidatus Limnocylindrales bacterium]
MSIRRYAEGTKVAVESSQGELAGILTKHGVKKQGWMREEDKDTLFFELGGCQYRLDIKKPTMADVRKLYPNAYDYAAKLDAEWRRRWRANVLLLKAKLEFIEGGDTTLDQELLPYRVLKDGRTLLEAIAAESLPMLEAGS